MVYGNPIMGKDYNVNQNREFAYGTAPPPSYGTNSYDLLQTNYTGQTYGNGGYSGENGISAGNIQSFKSDNANIGYPPDIGFIQ
jgi:hypothetical protein